MVVPEVHIAIVFRTKKTDLTPTLAPVTEMAVGALQK